MTDRNVTVDAAGCLGRALTVIGMLWIGFVILGGIGVLSELGWSGGFAAGFGGSIFPGLMLLVAGRAIRRRASATGGQPQSSVPGATPPIIPGRRVPSSRVEPAQKAPIPFPVEPAPPPRPAVKPPPLESPQEPRADVARRLEETLARMDEPSPPGTPPPTGAAEPGPVAPKTSQELIDEARKRWGMGRKEP